MAETSSEQQQYPNLNPSSGSNGSSSTTGNTVQDTKNSVLNSKVRHMASAVPILPRKRLPALAGAVDGHLANKHCMCSNSILCNLPSLVAVACNLNHSADSNNQQ